MSATPRTQFELVEAFWRELMAVDERLVHAGQRAAARRRTLQVVVYAVLALLAVAAIGLAARTLIFGDAAPHRFPSLARFGPGPLKPGSVHLAAVREPDPVAGPPWGVRLFVTTNGRLCYQVGRVVNGRLAALGIAGAFGDDGHAHALPVETEGCAGVAAPGHPLRFGARSVVQTADGMVSPSGCLVAEERRAVRLAVPNARRYLSAAERRGDRAAIRLGRRELRLAHSRVRHAPRPCTTSDLRTIFLGTTPPGARSVSIAGRAGTAAIANGIYLIVLAGPAPPSDVRLIAHLASGDVCALASGLTKRVCPGH